jgi:DNA topoisomerase-1
MAPSPTGADLVCVARADQNAKRTRRASRFHGSAKARQLHLFGPAPVWGPREPRHLSLVDTSRLGHVEDFVRGAVVLARTPEVIVVDPKDAAESAGLRYVSVEQPGLRRRKSGRSFRYLNPDDTAVTDAQALRRIRSIVIPPAWTEVWICRSANGHIQATGRDARGRKQYRYHPSFREIRDSSKYEHMIAFAHALPGVRAKVRQHMALRGLPREKVLATVVHLLETTLISVGNDDYARQNDSYGLTTLKNRHVAIDGAELRFRFKGKSGKQWSVSIKNRRVAKVPRACQELPSQELLQYVDEAGECQRIDSTDVNSYLREIAGAEITAKDFRTWAGTVLAALALREFTSFDSAAMAKRNIVLRSRRWPPDSATRQPSAVNAASTLS